MIDDLEKLIITEQVLLFRDFLIATWPHLALVMEDHDWRDDGKFIHKWVQGNWEILVEREILGEGNKILTPFNYYFMRTSKPLSSNPELYGVVTSSKHGSLLLDIQSASREKKRQKPILIEKPLRFCGFVIPTNFQDCYGSLPPFDFVDLALDEQKKLFRVPLAGLEFYLKKLPLSEVKE